MIRISFVFDLIGLYRIEHRTILTLPDRTEMNGNIERLPLAAGACRARPHVAGARPQVAGARPQVAGARPQVAGARPQVAGARLRVVGAPLLPLAAGVLFPKQLGSVIIFCHTHSGSVRLDTHFKWTIFRFS